MGKILIVEDNRGSVNKIKQFISHIDSDVTTVNFDKASDAYLFAQKEKIDLFILDIQLTDYKGTSLAKQLRSLPQYKYTPIIFESVLAGEELNAYRNFQCYGFLIKPYNEEEFRNTFCNALGLSHNLKMKEKKIQIEQKQFVFEYYVDDIVYVEAFGKKLVIHTNLSAVGEKEDTISGFTLYGLLNLINDESFVQCHKSYFINIKHIRKIDKTERLVFLDGCDKPVPLGDKYQKEVWKAI